MPLLKFMSLCVCSVCVGLCLWLCSCFCIWCVRSDLALCVCVVVRGVVVCDWCVMLLCSCVGCCTLVCGVLLCDVVWWLFVLFGLFCYGCFVV